jgi:hypothetical protein
LKPTESVKPGRHDVPEPTPGQVDIETFDVTNNPLARRLNDWAPVPSDEDARNRIIEEARDALTASSLSTPSNSNPNLGRLNDLLGKKHPEPWRPVPTDEEVVQRLLRDAKSALKESKGMASDASEKPKIRSSRAAAGDLGSYSSESDEDGSEDYLEDEAREAEEILAKLMDEVELDQENEPPSPPSRAEVSDNVSKPPTGSQSDKETSKPVTTSQDLSLPATPSTLPETAEPQPRLPAEQDQESLDFEAKIAARMAALKGPGTGWSDASDSLGLPSAPTTLPSKGVAKPPVKVEEDYWCVICQDDATVLCHGCDDQLYCARCWKEGHMGPDVGWEEKSHEWIRYKRPR